MKRPAETLGLSVAVATIIAYYLGVDDPRVVLAFAAVAGSVPAIVTWVVVTLRKRNG